MAKIQSNDRFGINCDLEHEKDRTKAYGGLDF